MANSNLSAAKRAKNDEFYTQLTDIEKELRNYKKHFRGKTVLCNCDDPFESGENELTELEGDGDFRSEECLALLEEADVVVTNPPFSLFREYVATLMEYGKKFIAIGSQNAITYKEFFPLLKNDEVWPGVTHPKEFVQRNGEIKKFGNICWFTNLDIRKRHEELILVKKYAGHEDEYPKYDNYDAIEVSKVVNIPLDYAGVMGVPITFLDKYSPDQFEIVGLTQRGCHDESLETKIYDDYWEMRPDGTRTGSSGNKTNGNPNLAMNDGKHNYFVNAAGHVVQSCYQRILIRNKHPEK